jgi:hypothetical protein
VKVEWVDFCGFEKSGKDREWGQMHDVLRRLSVYVKESGQAGRVGHLTFDPVGTNQAITAALAKRGWGTNISIPKTNAALGTDVDYGLNGVLAEGQFSNYPFFLNNILRAHIFHTKRVWFEYIGHVDACIVVTKVRAWPAANSTLYYEQAIRQMRFVVEANAVMIPTRVVGLTAEIGPAFNARVSAYGAGERSRQVGRRTTVKCVLRQGTGGGSRCRIVRLPG